ncbi:uncharacterized protein LOC113324735 [Papaver somniferum]|uniref:uncharacterized protein LOC113324735 n=1 Tax=Papaver somniferum TaxID=3469 RepID=UPI000E6FBEA7|nr:uncharacterized protein LOC113324735 [Papaver somniferum]
MTGIMNFCRTLEEHLKHPETAFQILLKNQLVVKLGKCSFGKENTEYLGHIITSKGIAADPFKIESMFNWPTPKTLKGLRGFLGLTGYYRKFVNNYGSTSYPLTQMLK